MLKEMDQERLGTHVRLLAWVHIVGELIGLGFGVLVFLFLTGIGAASGEQEAMVILPIVGIFALGMITIFSLPGLIAGIGLLRRWSWARYLALVVGFMDLFWVPIGTLVGIYTFWVLMQKGATEYFERGDRFADVDFDEDLYDEGPFEESVEEVYFHGDEETDTG